MVYSLEMNQKKNREQINNIRALKVDIKTNANEIQGIIRECFEILHSKTMESLLIINKFLDTCPTKMKTRTYKQPRSRRSNKIGAVKIFPYTEKLSLERIYCHIIKDGLTPIFQKLSNNG